jgi:cohesin complex subunit SA-1/2
MDISNNDATSTPVATGSRRKSGRAVKAPEKFVPDAPSSQPGAASAKRKRGGEDVENDALDVEEEAEDSDEELESAGEEEPRNNRRKAKPTKAAKKPAAKKPKVNGTAPHEETHAVRLPNRPKKTRKIAIADDGAEGLYGKSLRLKMIAGISNHFYSGGLYERRVFKGYCVTVATTFRSRWPRRND